MLGPGIGARGVVGHDTHRTTRPAGHLLHPVRGAVGQHDLPLDVFAGVVTLLAALTDVDQFGGDVRRWAIVSNGESSLAHIAQFGRPRLDQPQLAGEHLPVLVGPAR